MKPKLKIVNRETKEAFQFSSAEMAIAFLIKKDLRKYALVREEIVPWPRPGDPDALKIIVRKAYRER